MKLVVNNTLKPFVNNPEFYTPYIEEIAERIAFTHVALEQSRELDEIKSVGTDSSALPDVIEPVWIFVKNSRFASVKIRCSAFVINRFRLLTKLVSV